MQENKIVPLEAFGVKLMSIGFLLDADRALIWRGPLVAQLINQFLNEVDWGELDYLIIDLPPGTGDVQLTLVQKIPLAGAIIVTTPQDVALADAIKGIQMFQEVKTTDPGHHREHVVLRLPQVRRADRNLRLRRRRADGRTLQRAAAGPRCRWTRPSARAGDIGHPIVVSHPESPAGQAFHAAAQQAAVQLSIEAVKKPRRPTIMLRQAPSEVTQCWALRWWVKILSVAPPRPMVS